MHTVCKNDFKNHKQMTKQTTIVMIGSLRVNSGILLYLSFLCPAIQRMVERAYNFTTVRPSVCLRPALAICIYFSGGKPFFIWIHFSSCSCPRHMGQTDGDSHSMVSKGNLDKVNIVLY